MQAMVAATEQHWNAAPPANMQAAKYVCEAHVLSVGNPNLLFVRPLLSFQASLAHFMLACLHCMPASTLMDCTLLTAHISRCVAMRSLSSMLSQPAKAPHSHAQSC